MKRWKIYAGIVVITAILGAGLCMGSEVSISKASAEDYEINVKVAEVGGDVEKDKNDFENLEDTENELVENVKDDSVEKDNLFNSIEECSTEEEISTEKITEEVVNEAVIEAKVNADPKAKKEPAYKNVLEEEIYIAELVSLKSGKEYKTANWKECLKYLKDNYELLKRDTNVDMEKVDSYVYAYNTVEIEENKPQEVVNENVCITRTNYNPNKVTEYTNEYWDNPNPAYFSFEDYGGDCANFVSQAIYAGGKKMYGYKWDEFRYWFCRSKTDLTKISSSWRGAVGFGEYWKVNAKGYKTFDGSHFTSKEAQVPVYEYTEVGDAISFLMDSGRPYHTVVCSYKNRVYEDYPEGSKMIHFASHTGAHKWKSVYNYLKNEDTTIRVYNMY